MITSRINKMKSVVSDNDIEINRFAKYNPPLYWRYLKFLATKMKMCLI